MQELMLRLDTILISLIALGGIVLKIVDEIKRSARVKKVDAKDQEILDQIMRNRINSLQALIYSVAPLLMRMEAFLEYIKLGGNHSTVDYAIMEIIKDHQPIWWSVVEKYKNEEASNQVEYDVSKKKIMDSIH